jgi:hypothetical protein
MLKVIIHYLSDLYGKDKELVFSITYFEYNHKTGLYNALSKSCSFKLDEYINVNDLYNYINWINFTLNKNIGNKIVVVVKMI